MAIKKGPCRTTYLWETQVENLFICEYMPDAPGNYVKVYLYGLMEAELGKQSTLDQMARALRMSTEDVEKGFLYWEKAGLMKRTKGDVEILSLKEKLYGKQDGNKVTPVRDIQSIRTLDNQPMKELIGEIERIKGEFLLGAELEEISSWVEEYNVKPEVIVHAYRHFVKREQRSYKYIGTCVKNWAAEGISTKEELEEVLSENNQRSYIYKRVLKALGFARMATEQEKKIMDTWIDDLNLSMEAILKGCEKTSGISNPNINYVNSVLKNVKGDARKGPGRKEIIARYEEIRKENEEKAKAAQDEIESRVPQIKEIEKEIIGASAKMTSIIISGGVDKAERLAKAKDMLESLRRKKEMLLTENNIPVDFANIRYTCNACRDTGSKEDGSICHCYKDRYAEVAQAMGSSQTVEIEQ